MDSLKWIIFLCVVTSAAAANLPLSESSEENYVNDFPNYEDGSVLDKESDNKVDICTLPPVDHPLNQRRCSGFIPRWYYDVQSSSCKKFFWDGCWGTRNLFRNEFACLAKCNQPGLQQKISKIDPSAPACMQPKASGSCRASIPSYFFDVQTGKCTPFNYGGCGGNENRFRSYHECDFKCNRLEQAPLTRPQFANSTANASIAISASAEKVTAVQLTKEEKCSLPPVESSNSSCLAFILSWTFNSTAGECRSFVYEGCGKTANLFDSEDECNTVCSPEPRSGPSSPLPPCLQPKVNGPCRASISSFFFNATAGVCTPFNYGGCGGNDNRFTSEKACQQACSDSDIGLSMSEEQLLEELPDELPDELSEDLLKELPEEVPVLAESGET